MGPAYTRSTCQPSTLHLKPPFFIFISSTKLQIKLTTIPIFYISLILYAAVAIMHHRSRLTAPAAPLPSPIPTAKGTRSAASETFSHFLDSCLKIPELISLPPSLTGRRHQIPDIDFRSLSADSIASILFSAKQLGAFRIIGHGISAEELSFVVQEAESAFQNANHQSTQFVERVGDHEEISWVRNQTKNKPDQIYQNFWYTPKLSHQRFQNFCNNMEQVAAKIEAIAEQVSEIFCKHAKAEYVRRSEDKDWVFRIYRYDHDKSRNIPGNHQMDCERESEDHGLCIHLPLEHSQFYIQSERGPLTFDAGPGMLAVTIGKQLEGFKCVSGNMIFESDISRSQDFFVLQLKVPFSSNFRKKLKTISIADQVFIAIFLCLLYEVVVFMYTYIRTT